MRYITSRDEKAVRRRQQMTEDFIVIILCYPYGYSAPIPVARGTSIRYFRMSCKKYVQTVSLVLSSGTVCPHEKHLDVWLADC